jgi:hypothetical protein
VSTGPRLGWREGAILSPFRDIRKPGGGNRDGRRELKTGSDGAPTVAASNPNLQGVNA